jgi:hypothetical protein
MIMTTQAPSTTPASESLRILDPSLPLLAAQAAVEIDNLLISLEQKQTPGARDKSLPHLSKMLTQVQELSVGVQTRSMVAPIIGGNVLLRAYTDTFKSSPSTESLRDAMNNLLEAFSNASTDHRLSKDTLVPLRDFCATLSNYAASKRLSVYGNKPRHPYSR